MKNKNNSTFRLNRAQSQTLFTKSRVGFRPKPKNIFKLKSSKTLLLKERKGLLEEKKQSDKMRSQSPK